MGRNDKNDCQFSPNFCFHSKRVVVVVFSFLQITDFLVFFVVSIWLPDIIKENQKQIAKTTLCSNFSYF